MIMTDAIDHRLCVCLRSACDNISAAHIISHLNVVDAFVDLSYFICFDYFKGVSGNYEIIFVTYYISIR